MSIFSRKAPDVTPAVQKNRVVQLEFRGENNRSIKQTHRGVRHMDAFVNHGNGNFAHTIYFKDGSTVSYRDSEYMHLMEWKITFE